MGHPVHYTFTINTLSTHNISDGGWCICSLDPKQWWWSIKRPVSPEQHQAAHSRRVPEQSWGLLIIRHIVWGRHGDSAQMLKIAPKCSAAAAWLLPVRKCFFSVGGAAAGGDHRWATGRIVYFVPRTIVTINRWLTQDPVQTPTQGEVFSFVTTITITKFEPSQLETNYSDGGQIEVVCEQG